MRVRRRGGRSGAFAAAFAASLLASPAGANLMFVDNLDGNDAFTAQETAVIRAAQDMWSALIVDNQGDNSFTVTYTKADLPLGTLAAAITFVPDGDGIPDSGVIQVNQNLAGGFVDTTPDGNSEYQHNDEFPFFWEAKAGVIDPLTGDDVENEIDLLSTILHEIAHSIGFTAQYDLFAQKLGAAQPNGFRKFLFANGDEATLTFANSGTHTEPTEQAIIDGEPASQQNDMMNPVGQPGERLMISSLDLAILCEAYSYDCAQAVPEPGAALYLATFLTVLGAARIRRTLSPVLRGG